MDRKEKNTLRRRFWRSYISSVISIALVLFIAGLFAILLLSARKVSAYFKENVKLSVMLTDKATPSQAEQFAQNLAQMPQVAASELITQERGTQEMKDFLGEDFLEIFESNPIPASVDLQLKNEYFQPDSIARLKEILCEDPLVDDIKYEEGLISAINRNLRRVGIVFAFFVGLLAIISIVLVNNTVRLNIFSRRFSIRTMQLVGATRSFIQRPFLGNAVLQGALSALLAIGGLYAFVAVAKRQIPQLWSIIGTESFLYCGLGLLVLGILLCYFCTLVTVRRMTSMSVDRMYNY
ncbi:MAG: permease-like cell division protein FtsX [Bacteroidales bacterium]|nr:permease-like cell division protein FtsX [Bacteroidales bacterium]MBR6464859.1 permease-like cell division protein FtsX [Bacteroidales bacterium]